MRSDNEKTIKRTIKDSVFSALFSEKKYLRQLCKVLKPDVSEDNNILDQYIKFARVSDEQIKEKGRTKEAIEKIISICIENDILKEFLESRRAEVIDMLDTLYNQEYAVEAYGHEEREEGRREGIKDTTLRLLRNFMESMGTTAEGALAALRIPKNEWDQYIPQLS